jgi:hypothetical protein
MVKGIFFIGFALLIDGLQAMVAWMFVSLGAGLQAVTPVGGAIGGAIAGCAAGTGVSGCIQGGLAGGALGAAASALGIPLGVGLAFVSSVCIGITMGGGLIILLSIFGMYYPGYMWPTFIGEAMPGLDVIPGWTFLAIMCVLKKNAEENSGVVGFASGIAASALSPASATGGLGKLAAGVANTKARTQSIIRNAPDMQTSDESEQGQKVAQERQRLTLDVGREVTPRNQAGTQKIQNLRPANDNIQRPQAANDNIFQPYAKTA